MGQKKRADATSDNGSTPEEVPMVDGDGKQAQIIKANSTEKVTLKRNVTLMNGIGIIVGSIIGSGIFLTPKGVYDYAQSWYGALLVWFLSGVFSMIGAICFAELGTCIPRSGGDYAYVTEAFGEIPGFLILWVTVVAIRPATAAIVAIVFAEYAIKPLFPDCEPPPMSTELLAIVCVCLLTAINCISVKVTMKIQDLFTAAKLIALAVIIIAGFVYLFVGLFASEGSETKQRLTENIFSEPYVNTNNRTWADLSLSFYSGLFAYAGWNYLNFVTQELQDPYKNLPRAIYIGLPTVGIVYVLANIAYFIVLTPSEMMESIAVAVSFGKYTLGPLHIEWLIPIFVALSTIGGVNGTLFTASRMYFAGADEGQLFQIFKCIHVKYFTPIPALFIQCIITVTLLLMGKEKIGIFINCVSFVLWVSTGIAVAALIRLRTTKPNLPRPIKVHLSLPYIYVFATILMVGCSFYSDAVSTTVGAAITFLGIPVYYLFQLFMHNKSFYAFGGSVNKFLQKLMNVMPQEKSETFL